MDAEAGVEDAPHHQQRHQRHQRRVPLASTTLAMGRAGPGIARGVQPTASRPVVVSTRPPYLDAACVAAVQQQQDEQKQQPLLRQADQQREFSAGATSTSSRHGWGTISGAGLLLFRLVRLGAARLVGGSDGRGAAVGDRSGVSDVRVFPRLPPRAASPTADGGAAGRGASAPACGPALVWFRNDLRLEDHAALSAANAAATAVVPVFCFDPREHGQGTAGCERSGPARAAFVCGALRDLRMALRARGSDLIVRVGLPEEVLPQLAASVGAAHVYCHGEATDAERRAEAAVAAALQRRGAALEVLWGGTLLHPEDFPFKLGALFRAGATPSFAEFRERVGGGGRDGRGGRKAARLVAVRAPLEAPQFFKGFPAGCGITPGELPTLQQLGFIGEGLVAAAGAAPAMGAGLSSSEQRVLERMRGFDTGHGRGPAAHEPLTQAFVTKAWPWLAVGCVSPRTLYHAFANHERSQHNGARPGPERRRKHAQEGDCGASWLMFELLWRDFFRFALAAA